MCVIADAERAGCPRRRDGGRRYAKSRPTTTDVLIEAAQFAPLSIRTTARKLKLHSPSSYRFERGTDPEMVDWASRRACELILKHAGGELVEGRDRCRRTAHAGASRSRFDCRSSSGLSASTFRRKRCARSSSPWAACEQSTGAAEIVTIPPSWRRDLAREIDLVEEVARIHGYDKIPEDASVPMAASHRPDSDRVLAKVRQVLTAGGFDEAMTASVVPERWSDAFSPWTEAPPLVANTPMLEGADRLRRSLVPSLLDVRRINESLSNPTIELFETARIYLSTANGLPREQ